MADNWNDFIRPSYSSTYQSATMHSPMPTMRARGYSIPVTLTPAANEADRRHINITHGENVSIGRASKTDTRNLSAQADNALFDCPVVSRRHAELSIHPYKPSNEQVTIEDKDSMHGTYVNNARLEAFKPFSLRSGDEIRLGDKVMRGSDTHDGVVLRYDRTDNRTNYQAILEKYGVSSTAARDITNTLSYNTGFHVPSESEEESDMPSDNESVISMADHQTSSAKTTPEQPKAKLGSQQQPIDLETAASLRKIINIDDGDEDEVIELVPRSYSAPRPATVESEELGEPAAIKVISDTYEDDEEGEVESILERNTGLAQLLNHDSEDEDVMSEDSESHEHDYDDEPQDDDLSDSDASDLSRHYRDSPEMESREGSPASAYGAGSDDEAPELMSSRKQASPELGDAPEMEKVQETLFVSPTFNPPTPFGAATYERQSTQPRVNSYPTASSSFARYDPVRGSNPPAPASNAASAGSFTSRAPAPTSNYTYGYSDFFHAAPPAPPSRRERTDESHSSRWDVMPTFAPPPSTWTYPPTYATQSPYATEANAMPISQALPTQFYSYPLADQDAVIERARKATLADTQKAADSADSQIAPRSTTTRISIDDIVDEAMTTSEPDLDGHAIEADLQEMRRSPSPVKASSSKPAAEPAAIKTKAGGKRKADTMLEESAADEAARLMELYAMYAAPELPIAKEMVERADGGVAAAPLPTKKKSKSNKGAAVERTKASRASRALQVAKTLGLVTAGAAAGGAGLLAFLASPLSERLIEML